MSGEVPPEHDERAQDGKHDHGHDSSDDGVVNLLRGAFARPGVWKTGKRTPINSQKSQEDLIHRKKRTKNEDNFQILLNETRRLSSNQDGVSIKTT